jgi:hypothetical protein
MCDPLAGGGGRDAWLAHNKGAALKQPVYGDEPYLAPRPSFPISGAWQHTVARSPAWGVMGAPRFPGHRSGSSAGAPPVESCPQPARGPPVLA